MFGKVIQIRPARPSMGYTLVEVLMSMFVVAIMVTGMVAGFIQTQRQS